MPMPSPAERSPSVNPSTTLPGRRLLSRITSPFSNAKTRNIADYHIRVDDPHKQYGPGDQVTGAVHLRVLKPIRVTHVVVCLHGYVQVYKNPGLPPSEGYRVNGVNIGQGRGSKNGEYFGNGFASLFEDEVVLCGDGKLGEGAYQFEFNLEFPDRDLPSSISFERGTISYLITATITRPTTINPTIQCDKKVYFVERIDISNLLPPKARTITLEAISKRSKAKTQAKRLVDSERKSRKSGSKVDTSERRGSQTSSSPSLVAAAEQGLQSPSPSEQSFDSLMSGSQERNSQSQPDSNATSPRHSDASKQAPSKDPAATTKTINATVESMVGGTLRGDSITVKVHVNHIKHVKSLHGVIITLYRQARVDMHPAIPVGPTEKGKEAKYEDYYPKSATGLGGLSLSGAGSSHIFRKDLSQTIMPLIVDPATLTAEVTGKIHVGDDVFPTISTVPGAMISFRYYIEVVLDIQGKLSTQDRNLGNLGGLANTLTPGMTSGVHHDRSVYHGSGTPMIDTASVRRDKGVVSCTFEVVVGTIDHGRSRKGKQKAEPVIEQPGEPESEPRPQQANTDAREQSESHEVGYGSRWHGYDPYYDPYYYNYDLGPYAQQGYQVNDGYHHYNGYYDQHGYFAHDYTQPPPVPLPATDDESQLTEKERVRRAEQRLLPSQPPGAEAGASAGAAPSAPYLPDEPLTENNASPSAPPPFMLEPPAHVATFTNSTTSVSLDFASSIPLPRTPTYEASEGCADESRAQSTISGQSTLPTGSLRQPLPPTDDKRELERRNLHTSAPSVIDVDQAGPSTANGSTSPLLEDNNVLDAHDSHADASANSDLPRYER